MSRSRESRRFASFAWFVLAYTVLAAVWGAFVRATGSGSGCGNHWPLCNGEVVPRAPAVATVIEFTHRVTSGLIGLLVLALVLWAIRRFGQYHRVPRAAFAALVLTVVEALIGAALVRFDLVSGNASVLRGSVMAAHLVNTFLLLASLALTAAWASGVETPRLRGQGLVAWLLAAGLAALCVLGASGAVTALGDTLFPVATLTDDVIRGLSPAARLLVRLRIFHPFLAVGVGAYLAGMAAAVRLLRPDPRVAKLAVGLAGVFVLQLGAGLLNISLAAPVWLQLVHLGLAYVVWLVTVLFAVSALADRARAEVLGRATPVAAKAAR
jgi:heme A synthase